MGGPFREGGAGARDVPVHKGGGKTADWKDGRRAANWNSGRTAADWNGDRKVADRKQALSEAALPRGFRFAATACGLKKPGPLDLTSFSTHLPPPAPPASSPTIFF